MTINVRWQCWIVALVIEYNIKGYALSLVLGIGLKNKIDSRFTLSIN